MKKTFLLILTIVLLTGCTVKNENYYDSIANTTIMFFKNPEYDETKIAKNDREAISKYLSTITHINQIIDLTEYIDYNLPSKDKYEICSVDYKTIKNEIEIYKLNNPALDPFYRSTCQGYYATIYEEDLYPDYEYTKNNPEHNYILLRKNTKNDIKSYIYKSTYNGKGLMLKLHLKGKQIIKIDTEFVNANDYIQN